MDPLRDISIPFDFKEGIGFYLVNGGIETVHTIIKAMYDKGVPIQDLKAGTPYNDEAQKINSLFQQCYLESSNKYVDLTGRLWVVGDL